MALQSEGNYTGDWLKWEEENLYSREEVTILAGSGSARVLTSGMVLGKVTASGKYVQFNDTAADGSQTAAGVLIYDTTAPASVDVKAAIIARQAIVSKAGLTWPGTADAGEQAAALVTLAGLGIINREGA